MACLVSYLFLTLRQKSLVKVAGLHEKSLVKVAESQEKSLWKVAKINPMY